MIRLLLGWLTSGPLDRILTTLDKRVDNETERERLKSQIVISSLQAQASVLTGRSYWFPLLFLIPAGLHFAAVSLYSILFCRGCVLPQDWTIAALPPPFDEWQGVMVSSLFIGKAGEMLIARLRK